MPIIDPSLFFSLFEYKQTYRVVENLFFLHYLKVASDNLYRNSDTIQSLRQFKQDLKDAILTFNGYFNCQLTAEKDINNPTIKNFYKFIYDQIKTQFQYKMPEKNEGKYYYYEREKLKLFFPYVDLHYEHFWALSDTPIAILCIKYIHCEEVINYINLEIDLMISSGYSVVLCLNYEVSYSNYCESVIKMIKNHRFSEIHFTLEFTNKKYTKEDIEKIFLSIYNSMNKIHGYFYFYTLYVDSISSYAKDLLKKLKKMPRFKNIALSDNPKDGISSSYGKEFMPFVYCKNGFDFDKIQIILYDAPIYTSSDEEMDFVPVKTSENKTAFISKKDFLNWKKTRVKVLLNNDDNIFDYFYVNFDDIHNIKFHLFVNETLLLAKTNTEIINTIKEICSESREKTDNNDEFKREKAFSFHTKDKLKKCLIYVSYAYQKFIEKLYKNFRFHRIQIFTAYEACKQYLEKFQNSNIKNNGVVFQVETGEGKSSIICIIAACLVLMKKIVHIASSNINLSNRDYYESYDFFVQLGIKPAVLLHYNELPYISINNSHNQYNIYDKSKFPKKFYGKKLFKNPLNMNFSVCGIGNKNEILFEKADIVFSTLINFECFYLRMMEICPLYIDKYFTFCSLIIDEADSILIDELTNGTIISRPIKTNCEEILTFVYQSRISNKTAEEVFNEIKTRWPKCEDIKNEDILDMFQQIDLVNREEFKNGKKYTIEPLEIKEKVNLLTFFRQTSDAVINIKKNAKGRFKNLFSKNKKSEKTSSSFSTIFNRKSNKFKQIIPYDYDHKGILEPNKEFGGFVQQFIAIKEKMNNKNNENLIVKDISMNYLYVSHPIYISLYKGICGFTGTIGNKSDKQILKNHYNLTTMKIPRKYSSRRVEFPIITCDDIEERNNLIAAEVYEMNKKDIPVLIIFQDLNDIYSVFKILISIGIKNINIFDGKDENIKPDYIAGYKGAVSLGSNFCGRGTDIKNPYKPLHVIVSYFTSNIRVMKQSFGRTARHKQSGTSHIICLKDEFISSIKVFNKKQINNILNDFQFKNALQMEFISSFRNKRPWIFSNAIHSQTLSEKDIFSLRDVKINVNRIIAYNYEYPICMSIPTFLIIQAQKIFSLYNCPNCKYTWMLFQKYIREMILESWSLFIEKIEKKYNQMRPKIDFQNFMKLECKELHKWLTLYLPESEKNYDVVSTFMHIFNIVKNMYENKILSIFPETLIQSLKQIGKRRFCSFTFGFKPFSLIDESGSRINIMNGDEQQLTFIQDPELQYLQKLPQHAFSVISITEKIDGIFNMICQKINDIIGSYIGLRFFLRRTLGGCEFGVCYDFDLENNEINILKEHNCLFDKDPLFVFTITVKSNYPVMAGILIIGLVYVASIAKSIIEWILTFPEKAIKELTKKTIKAVASLVVDGQIDSLCSSVCSFLEKILLKQIEKMKEYKVNMAKLFHELLIITHRKDFAKSGNIINELFKGKTKVKINSILTENLLNEHIPFHHFLKIGFLLILCFASFMLNFHFHRQSIKYDSKKVSSEYDKKQNTNETFQKNQNLCQNEKIDKKDFQFKNNDKQTDNK